MVRLTRREALLLALRDMERKEAYGVDPAPIVGETMARASRRPYRPEPREPRTIHLADVIAARIRFDADHKKEGRTAHALVMTNALYERVTKEQNVVALPTYCGLTVRVRDVANRDGWDIE
jgi:hypothetical protein